MKTKREKPPLPKLGNSEGLRIKMIAAVHTMLSLAPCQKNSLHVTTESSAYDEAISVQPWRKGMFHFRCISH